jgi:hypothetical protein
MKKRIVIGCVLTVFLMVMLPAIPALGTDIAKNTKKSYFNDELMQNIVTNLNKNRRRFLENIGGDTEKSVDEKTDYLCMNGIIQLFLKLFFLPVKLMILPIKVIIHVAIKLMVLPLKISLFLLRVLVLLPMKLMYSVLKLIISIPLKTMILVIKLMLIPLKIFGRLMCIPCNLSKNIWIV